MRNYIVFLKKEMLESAKTYKLLIMGIVFLFFGMLSPLTARFMPEILKLAMETDPSMAGMDFRFMNEPTAFDSWTQFYSNVGQMGLIVLVIIFSGMISSELSRGTLTIMLSKGLSRSAVILSKFTSALIVWTGSFALSALTAWGYTAYMFEGSVPNLFFAMLCIWLFGVFLLALTAFTAVLTKKGYVCMLSVGVVVIILNVLNIIPAATKYNPVSLLGTSVMLLNDTVTPRGVFPALVVTLIGIAAFTLLAAICFDKRKAVKKKVLLASAVAVCMFVTIFIGEEMPRQISVGRYVVSENIIIGEGTQWELHGILTFPRNAEGSVPAVVLVHGSGAQDMDETLFDNKPFRDIAEHLSQNGIAVVRYNKRSLTHGTRMSELNNLTVWEETIEDAISAAEMLRADPRIDEDRVYILGHSLGGMLAPRIHVMGGDFAGIIIFAGSPRFLFDISREQVMALVNATEDADERASILQSHYQLADELEIILSLSDEEARNSYFRHWGNMGYYWWDLYNHPAALYIEQSTVPFLVMHPDDDVQVLTDVDFAMYRELLGGRTNVTFKLYPGLNHLFMPSKGRDISEIMNEYRIRANVDQQVLRDIAEWISDN